MLLVDTPVHMRTSAVSSTSGLSLGLSACRPVGLSCAGAEAYVFYFELGQSGAEGFQFVNDSDFTRCLAANGARADTGWLSIRSEELSIPTVWWLNQAIPGVCTIWGVLLLD